MPSLTEETDSPLLSAPIAPVAPEKLELLETEPPAPDTIHQGDCVELLSRVADESIDLAFADPPYNIGFKYDEYHDRHTDEVYLDWCRQWIAELYRVVKPTGAFWLAIGDEYAAELKIAAKKIGFTTRNWVIWYYTFGQNCRRKFNRSHAHLFHFVKDEERHTFNAADPAIRVPSARALVYGDRRANPTGRLPDDTWIAPPAANPTPPMDDPAANDSHSATDYEPFVLRPQDLRDDPAAFHPQDDTWYYSRVAGTFKERQGFHGCQMPEQMIGRIVRVSSREGELVLDPFAGSGTTLAVAKKLGRRWLGFELSRDYVHFGTERVESVAEGDSLCGPADPVRSAPTTAKGRRLKGHPMADAAAAADSKGSPRPAAASNGATTALAASIKNQAPPPNLRDLTRDALIRAFHESAQGASLDWVLCRDDLQAVLHSACDQAGLIGGPADWNRELLKLRKTGRLKANATPTSPTRSASRPSEVTPEAAFAGEIAWSGVRSQRPGVSLDLLLSDPVSAAQFDRIVAEIAPDQDASLCRWAALRLRKSAKTFKDDANQYAYVVERLISQAVASRARKFTPHAIKSVRGTGGVYVLADGPKLAIGAAVYVGESDDLGATLEQRLVRPLRPGAVYFRTMPDHELPSNAYRHALRWNLTHQLRPRLAIDLLAEDAVH